MSSPTSTFEAATSANPPFAMPKTGTPPFFENYLRKCRKDAGMACFHTAIEKHAHLLAGREEHDFVPRFMGTHILHSGEMILNLFDPADMPDIRASFPHVSPETVLGFSATDAVAFLDDRQEQAAAHMAQIDAMDPCGFLWSPSSNPFDMVSRNTTKTLCFLREFLCGNAPQTTLTSLSGQPNITGSLIRAGEDFADRYPPSKADFLRNHERLMEIIASWLLDQRNPVEPSPDVKHMNGRLINPYYELTTRG